MYLSVWCFDANFHLGITITFTRNIIYFYLFIQNLYSALFTNKRALMRCPIIKSITKSYYSESKNIYVQVMC